MEKEWANALKDVPPKNVKVNIKPIYTEDSLRPDKFILKYQIEGNIAVRRVILNGNGG